MTREGISARARKVVLDHFASRNRALEVEIEDGTEFIRDLGGDSLDSIEIVMGLESEFDIEISDDIAAGLLTFGNAVDHLATALDVVEPEADVVAAA